ncbi:MAG TPA: NHL repeat-containing protein [Gemmataceae bacterium]
MRRTRRRTLIGVGIAGLAAAAAALSLFAPAGEIVVENAPPGELRRFREATAVPPPPPRALRHVLRIGREGPGGGEFAGPFGVSISADGEVYVTDDLGHSVQVFDRDGTFRRRIGGHGTAPGRFAYPDCTVTDGRGLVVADTGNNRVQFLDASGAAREQLRGWGWLGRFRNPRAVALDGQGRLFVADWGNDCVHVFGPDWRRIRRIGRRGGGAGEFRGPIALALGPAGALYVSDFGNHRVQVFDAAGRFLSAFGEEGAAPGRFDHPVGLARDGAGRLYVADQGNRRVQVFTPRGEFLAAFTGDDAAGVRLDTPCGLAVGAGERLHVADAGAHCVWVFAIE